MFRDVAAPWGAEERVAAVSAFGFGGTNFHAVLSSHGKIAAKHRRSWIGPRSFSFCAPSRRSPSCASWARSKSAARSEMPSKPSRARGQRCGVPKQGCATVRMSRSVATSHEDMRAKLAAVKSQRPEPGVFLAAASTAGTMQAPGSNADASRIRSRCFFQGREASARACSQIFL